MALDQSVTSVVVSLLTLTMLEIVLGVDNIVFISLLSTKVEVESRAKARTVGLSLALITRILLLSTIFALTTFNKPLFTLGPYIVSGKVIILLGGGLFLIYKATREIYEKIDLHEEPTVATGKSAFWSIVAQILVIDIVFSLDSVITAVGMAKNLSVMVAAVIIALAIMLIFSHWTAEFIEKHPSIKVLALSFLILIGANLVGEAAFEGKIIANSPDRGFTYFAMAFATATELVNLRARKKRKQRAEQKSLAEAQAAESQPEAQPVTQAHDHR